MELILAALLLLWLGRKPRNESEQIEQGLLAALLLIALTIAFGASLVCNEEGNRTKPPSC
ncbi:MAG: hypothetical protein CME06_06765 [Gemmatimonadetes bacterium]|nr:hypothetical protein [Gemmatimonadota bacterium]